MSSQRNYRELCNRSSTSSHGMGHAGLPPQHHCDMFEDYWEDASVSLRSCHSWEAASSPWLGGSARAPEKTDQDDEVKRFSGTGSSRIRPQRFSFDANDCMASFKGRRSFPPPLALCSTLSIKEGGRFVLKEMDADRPQGFFRAQRGNGRLRLQLVLPDEVNDEEDNHDKSSSSGEGIIEPGEFDHVEHDAHVEETTTGNYEDCSTAEADGIRSNMFGSFESLDNSEGLLGDGHVCKDDGFEVGRHTVHNVVPDTGFDACSTSQDAGMGVRYSTLDKSSVPQAGMNISNCEGETISALDGFYSNDQHLNISNCGNKLDFLEPDSFLTEKFLTFGNQFVTESSNCNVEQEALWNVDVGNQALASLSPWSPKQICLHQSITCMRPVLGLAMS